jgi:3-oxoadipate enol-lactonase
MADRARDAPPEPPVELPPARMVRVHGRGEFFVRDSGSAGPPLLLLHGWMFQGDITWYRCYETLAAAGYRLIAIDHRGHGHGIRTPGHFRLSDCADDAAAVVRELGCGPVTAFGYSMGGAIGQLIARDHADVLSGLVLSATAGDWTEPYMRRAWKTMGALRLLLGLFPAGFWRVGLKVGRFRDTEATPWVASELTRGSAHDIAEAGRELGRFDARPWLHSVNVPAAVLVTARDRSVPPRKQRELADRLGARRFEFAGDHDSVILRARDYAPALLDAIEALREAPAKAA